MLAIRLQRMGRKGFPTYRVAVQQSHRHPTSGRVVAYLGSYNPHTKVSTLDTEKANFFLSNGAQPTPRVVRLLAEHKVDLPAWVKSVATDKKRAIKSSDKLRRNQPKEEAPVEEPTAEQTDAPADETSEA